MNNKKDSGASGVADLPLPANWSMKMSKSYPGKMYYVNKVTKESSWRHPLDKTPTNKKKTGSAPHLASHKSTKGTNSMEDASSSCSSTPNLGPSAVSAISHLSEEEQVHVMGFKSKTQQKSAPLMSLATDSNNSTLNDSVIYLRTDPNNSTLNDSVICLHSDPADTKKSEAKAIPEESSSKECSDKRKTRSKKKKKKKKKSKGAPELEKQSDAKAERILGKDSRCDLKHKLAVSPSQEMTSKGLSLSDCNAEKVTSTPSSGACLSNSRPVLKAKRRSKGLEEDSSAKHSQVNRVEPAAVSQKNTEKERQADIVLDPLPTGRDSYHDHSPTSSSSSNFGFRDAPILPSVSDSSVIIVEPNDYSTDQRADSSVIVLDNTHDVIDLCTPMKRRRVSSKSDGTLTLPTRPQLTMISHINLLAKKQDVGCESMSHKVKEVMPVASPEKIANEMKRKKPGLPGECSSEKSSREIAYNESTSELPREKSSAYGAEAVLSSKKSVEQCEISTQQQPSQSSAAFPLPGDVGVNDGLADGTDATETVREIEDMDFEEVGEIVLLNIQNLRRNSSHLTCAPIGTLTEAVAKSPLVSSPVVIKIEESPEKHKALILVVDTNVLISCLTFLSEIMNADLPGLGIPTLVLPWVVMQELDFIKDSRKRRDRYNEMTWRRAVEAVHFIHAKLNTKDQNLIGQPPKEAYQKTDMVISSNDDRILQCCVQWKEKCPDDHVILLSRDLNLTNKSVIMGISAANTETLWNELRMPKPNLKLLQKPPSNETTQKGNQNVAATSGKSKNSEGSHV
ncbi:uncharacterized protein LOC101853413, partial [Aplysia californica]|uniref:Uncharacterized protein LOC101853413 n=1 Tax=Aplysia californica TaxID=6500 RepID=A0ABM1AA94_APLCA